MSKEDKISEKFERGLAKRRKVLGDAHVDKAMASTTDLNNTFQDFITRYAWGEVWESPQLDDRSRSLITLSMLIASGHEDEFKIHIRGAFNNGVTVEDLKGLFMHTAIYCGVPAANNGFRLATEVLKEMGKL